MYALYRKTKARGEIRYRFKSQESLFGCNNGFIPRLFQKGMHRRQREPFAWHLAVQDSLAENGYASSTFIIDIKPNNAKPTLHLSELSDVWGYSADGWTPILLRTYPLFVEDDPKEHDRNDFSIRPGIRAVSQAEVFDPVYSTLYLQGSINSGRLIGTWNPPRASPTNSALLWPDALRYFLSRIANADPVLFEQAAQQGAAPDAAQRRRVVARRRLAS